MVNPSGSSYAPPLLCRWLTHQDSGNWCPELKTWVSARKTELICFTDLVLLCWSFRWNRAYFCLQVAQRFDTFREFLLLRYVPSNTGRGHRQGETSASLLKCTHNARNRRLQHPPRTVRHTVNVDNSLTKSLFPGALSCRLGRGKQLLFCTVLIPRAI